MFLLALGIMDIMDTELSRICSKITWWIEPCFLSMEGIWVLQLAIWYCQSLCFSGSQRPATERCTLCNSSMAPFLSAWGPSKTLGFGWEAFFVAHKTPKTRSPQGASPENKTLALKAVQASLQTWENRWIPCNPTHNKILQRNATSFCSQCLATAYSAYSENVLSFYGWKGCCQSRKWIYRLGKICFGFRRSP